MRQIRWMPLNKFPGVYPDINQFVIGANAQIIDDMSDDVAHGIFADLLRQFNFKRRPDADGDIRNDIFLFLSPNNRMICFRCSGAGCGDGKANLPMLLGIYLRLINDASAADNQNQFVEILLVCFTDEATHGRTFP